MHLSFVSANVLEWQLWCAIKDTHLAKDFGKCLAISETGRFLLMGRLDDIPKSDWPNIPAMPGTDDPRAEATS